jgi:hypothetical protein
MDVTQGNKFRNRTKDDSALARLYVNMLINSTIKAANVGKLNII